MTNPPPEPNVYSAPPYPQTQQPWTDPHGRGWPGAPAPVEPPKGAGLGVAALIVGLLGCAVPLLPMNMDGIRAYTPVPFAVLGILLAVLGCIGRRRGKALAVVGWMLSVLALIMGLIMIVPRLT